jgi:hypothetical protein
MSPSNKIIKQNKQNNRHKIKAYKNSIVKKKNLFSSKVLFNNY